MSLTARQMLAITATERFMSVLSIIGSLFIMGTFMRWHYFRKPINRLVFYASFGNVMANVATLISTSALPSSPGSFSALCEFQGILIQWFMTADSFWVLCMAVNVMMVFFRRYNSRKLRRLEKWYILFSYGVPFIPAFVFLLIDHYGTQPIIGPATIWCWVSSDVEWIRIAFFYAPVWLAVSGTLGIYIFTGRIVFKRRAITRSFLRQARAEAVPMITNPFTAANTNEIVKTTEFRVHAVSERSGAIPTAESSTGVDESCTSFSSTRNLSNPVQSQRPATSTPARFSSINWAGSSREAQSQNPSCGYKATVSATNANSDLETGQPRSMPVAYSTPHVRSTTAMEGNTAGWGYFKVAFLMFLALFVVWVPSTINRLQQFIHKGNPIFSLNLISATVLPMQGFWNAMVYMSTTLPECKRAITEVYEMISSANRFPMGPSPSQLRKDSQYTLTTNDTNEFEAETPLSEIPNQNQDSPQRLHPRLSSTEPMDISTT